MKKVLGFMSKLVGGLFSLAVLALLMSLTYGACSVFSRIASLIKCGGLSCSILRRCAGR